MVASESNAYRHELALAVLPLIRILDARVASLRLPPERMKRIRPVRRFWRKTLLLDMWSWKCAYCKSTLDVDNVTVDHVWPKSEGGKVTFCNIVPACRTCQVRKGSKFYLSFLKEMGFSQEEASEWFDQVTWRPVLAELRPNSSAAQSRLSAFTDSEVWDLL